MPSGGCGCSRKPRSALCQPIAEGRPAAARPPASCRHSHLLRSVRIAASNVEALSPVTAILRSERRYRVESSHYARGLPHSAGDDTVNQECNHRALVWDR